jgi:hypothetical protein
MTETTPPTSKAPSTALEEINAYRGLTQDAFDDVEKAVLHAADNAQLMNSDIRTFLWRNVKATVKDRQNRQPKVILENVDGLVEAGMYSLLLHIALDYVDASHR